MRCKNESGNWDLMSSLKRGTRKEEVKVTNANPWTNRKGKKGRNGMIPLNMSKLRKYNKHPCKNDNDICKKTSNDHDMEVKVGNFKSLTIIRKETKGGIIKESLKRGESRPCTPLSKPKFLLLQFSNQAHAIRIGLLVRSLLPCLPGRR